MRVRELRDRRPASKIVLLACCLVAGSVLAASGAEGPSCARFALNGIAPGMRLSEVRTRMGAGGTVEPVPGTSGMRTSVTYSTGDAPVTVLYDRDISRDPDARVVLVRARGRANLADPVAFVRSLVPGLGEPVLGVEHLDDGFRHGATVWEDDGCGVEITAFRKETEWWQPGQGDLLVQIESSSAAEDAATRADSAAPSAARGGTAAVPRTEPPKELTVVLEAAPQPPDSAPPTSAAPTSAPVAPVAETAGPTRIPESYVEPLYPERAQRMQIAATVVLSVQVKSDGSVGEVDVVETTRKGMGFEQAAVDAVKRWRYRPATRDGKAEDAVIAVRINFK